MNGVYVESNFQRVRIDLAYDGGAFAGWAKQPGLVTVQGCLEQALALITRVDLQVTVAGRTDAGVHASAQTVHVDIPRENWARIPGRSKRAPKIALETRLRGAMTRVLADAEAQLGLPSTMRGFMQGAISIHHVSAVSADFDARFSALSRRYEYLIADNSLHQALPVQRLSCWQVESSLDIDYMNNAARELLGLHDFLSFCKPRVGATTIRELRELEFERRDDAVIAARIVADAFCHNMVRSLVGSLVMLGAGERSYEWLLDRIENPQRDATVKLAPANGLSLAEISYPEAAHYKTQAERTRNTRKLPVEKRPK